MKITANTTANQTTNQDNNAGQIKRRLGFATAITGLALFAGACGFGGPTVESAAAPDAPTAVEIVEMVDLEVAVDTTDAVEDGKDATANPAPEFELGEIEPPATPETPAPAATPAPPAPTPVVSFCSDYQYPIAEYVEVINIQGSGPDSGLRVRTAPGVGHGIVEVAPQGTVLPISYTDDFGGCAVVDGDVWWSVIAIDGLPGWIHSFYATEFFGFEEEIPDFHGEEAFGEEIDAHADCLNLPSNGIDCLVVYRTGGVITFIEAVDTVSVEFAQLDCVYNGFLDACDVLEYLGFGFDTNYGLGNSLSMAPTEFLQQDCNDFGHTPAGVLACAELDFRI